MCNSDGAVKEGKEKPAQKCAETRKECPKQKKEVVAKIVSIAWLDGSDDKEIASGDQWVNLPRDDKWVNGSEIKNKDRLGMKPRLKVKFDKEGVHAFKVKLLEPTGTAAYTVTEKNRNGNFKYTDTETSLSTDADGTKIFDALQLVAGGGYKFKAEAKDDQGTKVKTGDLTTKRLFYYVEAKMTGLSSVLNSTSAIDAEYAKHEMILKSLSALSIARQHNIGTDSDTSTLAANVDSAVNGSDPTKAKKPYLLTVAYTDHLAVKNSGVEVSKASVTVGPGKPKVEIPIAAPGLLSPYTVKTRYLWHDLVPGEGWFVSAVFEKDGGGTTNIPTAKVTHNGSGNYWNKVEVDVTGLEADAVGTVKVVVNVVDRMRAGLALGGGNQTCVCTRAWWSDMSNADQAATIIHEFGHKVGMVADGTGKLPDKVSTHYKDKGHVGDHCYKGCPAGETDYSTSAMNTAATCTMYGSVKGINAFCANCKKATIKLDVNSGW